MNPYIYYMLEIGSQELPRERREQADRDRLAREACGPRRLPRWVPLGRLCWIAGRLSARLHPAEAEPLASGHRASGAPTVASRRADRGLPWRTGWTGTLAHDDLKV